MATSDLPPDLSGDTDFTVCVRCRPISMREKDIGAVPAVQVDPATKTITVDDNTGNNEDVTQRPARTFTYDAVYGPNSSQTDIFNTSARPIVDAVLEGYNGAIFTYGQTGAGKAFTMEGEHIAELDLQGIIPRTFQHIFTHVENVSSDIRYSVKMSCFEIYQEQLQDMLAEDVHKRLQIKEKPGIGVYVNELTWVEVTSADQMNSLYNKASTNSKVRVTHMGCRSSKINRLCSVCIERSQTSAEGIVTTTLSQLYLVVLAGSERTPKTSSEGAALKEAASIGQSLSSFGSVVSALTDEKSKFVPYRDSKVTRLLQKALGGDCKTLMMVNIGPADFNHEETISSLRYAKRASKIKNKATIQAQTT